MTSPAVEIHDAYELGQNRKAVQLLRNLQRARGFDLNCLIALLEVFHPLSKGKILYPRGQDYFPHDEMIQKVTAGIKSIAETTLTLDARVVYNALPCIIVVYELYFQHVSAIAVHNFSTQAAINNVLLPAGVILPPLAITSHVPANDLDRAQHRLQFLRPIDDLVSFFRQALDCALLNRARLSYIATLAYHIVSQHSQEQIARGQSPAEFFSILVRPTSSTYLALVYRPIEFEFLPGPIQPTDVLIVAKHIVDPIAGALEQALFLKSVFRDSRITSMTCTALKPRIRDALRSPYDVWPALQGHCIQCGSQGGKLCSIC